MLRNTARWGSHQHVISCLSIMLLDTSLLKTAQIYPFKCFKYPLKFDLFAYVFHVVHVIYSFVILHMCCFSWIIYWWSPIKIFVIRSSKQGNSSGLSLTTNISLWICLLVLAFSTRKRNWEMMKLWQYCLDKSERVKTIFQHSPPTPLSLCFFPRFLFSLATYITLIATTQSAHSVSEHKSLPTHLSFPFHLLCELAYWRELGFPASSAQVTFPWLPYRMPTYIPKISVCWRSSSNILETLALGWDSFGLEYTISIVCWLLVILEKPKSCHVSSCLSPWALSRQWQHGLWRKLCLHCLCRHSQQRPCPSAGQPNVSACGSLGTNYMQLPAILKGRKDSLEVWGVPIAAYFTPLWSVLWKLFHTNHNFFWFL